MVGIGVCLIAVIVVWWSVGENIASTYEAADFVAAMDEEWERRWDGIQCWVGDVRRELIEVAERLL